MNVTAKREGFQPGVVEHPTRHSPQEPQQPPQQHAPPELQTDFPKDEAPEEVWPIKVRLKRPIRSVTGELLHEISFREPTGGDINRYGNPVWVNQDGEVVIAERKMTTIIAALSGLLPPIIDTLDPRDWNSCAYRLRGFFLPDPACW